MQTKPEIKEKLPQTAETQRIIQEHCERLYATNFNNPEETNMFLKIVNFLDWNMN